MEFIYYLIFVFISTFLAGLLPLAIKNLRRYISLAVSFAGGILIGTALLHLLPESFEVLGRTAGLAVATGFIVFYLPQKFMMTHPCEEGDCDYHSLGMMAFFGIGFHSLIDGAAIGASSALPGMGVVTAAVTSHKMPDALALSFLLVAAGISMRKTVLLLFLFSLATPIGAAFTKAYLTGLGEYSVAFILGFSGGNFISIAGSDFMRRLHEHEKQNGYARLAFFAAGCLLTLL